MLWYRQEANGSFTKITASSGLSSVRDVFACDLDNDGDLDIATASYSDDKIAWIKRLGTASFSTITITTAMDGARAIYAIDVDEDGDMDLLSASYKRWRNKLV